MLKAILLTETLMGWGGQQNKVFLEALALRELGIEVFLVCNKGSIVSKKFSSAGFVVREIKMIKSTIFVSSLIMYYVCKRYSISTVFTHGSTDTWVAILVKYMMFGRLCLIREKHNAFSIDRYLTKKVYRNVYNRIFAVSEYVGDQVLSVGVDREKIKTIPDAVDTVKFSPSASIRSKVRKRHGVLETSFVVGVLTTISRKKGLESLLEVVSELLRHEDIVVLLVGKVSPENRAYISSVLDRANKVGSYQVIGFTDFPEEYMASFDVYIHLSEMEGLGTVIIEAMSSGLPVLVWDLRPMKDIVGRCSSRDVIRYGDYNGLIDRIMLYKKEPSEMMKVGRVNRNEVLINYSYEKLVSNLRAAIG